MVASPKPAYGSPVTLWKTAERLGYRTWAAESVKDPMFARQVRADDVDVLLNVHSLHIINKDVLRAPKLSSFNLHPGPLPRYAGLNPVCWALLFRRENPRRHTAPDDSRNRRWADRLPVHLPSYRRGYGAYRFPSVHQARTADGLTAPGDARRESCELASNSPRCEPTAILRLGNSSPEPNELVSSRSAPCELRARL